MSIRPALAFVLALCTACTAGGDAEGTSPETCTDRTRTSALPSFGGPGAALEEVRGFGENPAGLKMYVHAPAAKTPTAVVLALHGCTQGAADYVATGWNELADREGLVIVYGEQSSTNNPMRCFRWWDAAQIGRDRGEAKSLASMVAAAHARFGTKRAFVTGLSAGGAMTSVMLATYPDVFEAGAIMAGLPYRCASSQLDSFSCMTGRAQSADAWAALVPQSSSASPPRVSIWQGEADFTVRPANREELVKQWTRVNGISETPDATTTEGRATHAVFHDPQGIARVESWSIAGMGHGVALDAKGGCGAAGAYALDVGVCSTERTATFFLGERTEQTATSPEATRPASPTASSPCP